MINSVGSECLYKQTEKNTYLLRCLKAQIQTITAVCKEDTGMYRKRLMGGNFALKNVDNISVTNSCLRRLGVCDLIKS